MEIVIAILSSGVISAVIAGIFNLILNRKGRLSGIEDKLSGIDHKLVQSEKDALRTQLLLMMSDYPHEKQEILKLAEHYFKDLNANWYASDLFEKWCKENDIVIPSWFNRKEK